MQRRVQNKIKIIQKCLDSLILRRIIISWLAITRSQNKLEMIMKTEYTGTIEVPVHVLLTVRRPNGEIEKVEVTPGGYKAINDKIFAQMVKATKDAGRGDILSYENIKRTENYTVKLTDADIVGIESDKMAAMMAYGEK